LSSFQDIYAIHRRSPRTIIQVNIRFAREHLRKNSCSTLFSHFLHELYPFSEHTTCVYISDVLYRLAVDLSGNGCSCKTSLRNGHDQTHASISSTELSVQYLRYRSNTSTGDGEGEGKGLLGTQGARNSRLLKGFDDYLYCIESRSTWIERLAIRLRYNVMARTQFFDHSCHSLHASVLQDLAIRVTRGRLWSRRHWTFPANNPSMTVSLPWSMITFPVSGLGI
jgi:hypothetical protein